MPKIILQPAGHVIANRHYVDTVENPVEFSRIKPFLTSENYSNLLALYPENKAPVWGVTPGRGDRNKKRWDKISVGDINLFSGQGAIFASGTTTLKIHNKLLALELWKENAAHETWEYVYFIDEIKKIHIPYEKFNREIGYAKNAIIRDFKVLDEKKSENVILAFNLESKVYLPEVSKNEYEEAVRELSDDSVADKKRLVACRTEQNFLRRNLFRLKKIADCGICGRTLPVDLLIASHIKPRAQCNLEERKDYKNLVLPMCGLGCDELFERGYISVENGNIIVSGLPFLPSSLKDYFKLVVGRRCGHWSEKSKKYFEWHKAQRFA